jgi:hypothetical protein
MQPKSLLSRPNCASVLTMLAATALLAFANPARAQTIMCVPGSVDDDQQEIVWVPADDERDRDGGVLWFLAGGVPALFELFHHGGSSHSTFENNVGPQLPGTEGGTGSNGSWNGGTVGGGDINNPPPVVIPQNSGAVPEPGQLVFLAAPMAAGLLVWRRRAAYPSARIRM